MFGIQTIDANDQLLEIELEGATYFLRMSWNSEAEFWALEVQDYNRQAIVSGIAIVPNLPLLHRIHHLAVPPGELIALVLSDPAQIDRKGFVTGAASLVYVSAAEVAQIVAGGS